MDFFDSLWYHPANLDLPEEGYCERCNTVHDVTQFCECCNKCEYAVGGLNNGLCVKCLKDS